MVLEAKIAAMEVLNFALASVLDPRLRVDP